MLNSGTRVTTTVPIISAAGAQIPPGIEAMVLGVVRGSVTAYVCETLEDDQFEQEEFYCLPDQLAVKEREA